jgi:hypothetical protein
VLIDNEDPPEAAATEVPPETTATVDSTAVSEPATKTAPEPEPVPEIKPEVLLAVEQQQSAENSGPTPATPLPASLPAPLPASLSASQRAPHSEPPPSDIEESKPPEVTDAETVMGAKAEAVVEPLVVAAVLPEKTIVVFDSAAVASVEPADSSETEEVIEALQPLELPKLPPDPVPPDPLSGRAIDALIKEKLAAGLLPVRRNGSAYRLLHDLDGNGYNDAFVLAVKTESREEADFEKVHDFSRLYHKDREELEFFIQLFYQRKGTLVSGELVSLGKRLVLDSFHPQTIVSGHNSPFAAAAVFTTPQGRVREWIIFDNGKTASFTMLEKSGVLPQIEDIDLDGILDVVMHEQMYDAAIGNETYLTWYRWNGSAYIRHKTVNVVRNLRMFLQDSFALVRDEDWPGFSRYALSKSVRNQIDHDDGKGDFHIFKRIFTPAPSTESLRNEVINPDDDFRNAVYPDIHENPFSERDSLGFFFPLTVRFETGNGRKHLYNARVYMLSNPFAMSQFSFGVSPD